jgi:MYXO-CTERM domain-containing protein
MFRKLFRSAVLAAMLAVVAAPAVLGYLGQVPHQVTVSCLCGSASQTTAGVTAVVTDVDGNPVANQAVEWTVSPTGVISPAQSTTNASGEATAVLTVASGGRRTITARAGDASGQAVVTCGGGVLPNTSTDAGGSLGWQIGLAGLALLAGATLVVRRLTVIRR